MAHRRIRHCFNLFKKRLKSSRVVAIQGCRQSGKSYFSKELLAKSIKGAEYVTFDRKVDKDFATDKPDTFLEQYELASPLLIDEAQKVPEIFDAVKLKVDERPTPGRYVLLGSTEFSKLMRIRESLTGRMSRIQLYPLNIAECLELPPGTGPDGHLLHSKARITRSQLLRHLEKGGFPGTFALREERDRADFLEDWLALTLDRDLQQFPGLKVNSALAGDVLRKVAKIQEPNASNIARELDQDTRTVQRILTLLETLFVVNRLAPHRLGTGKPLYFLCEVGLASHLGASFERKLWTWLLHEQLSQRSYRGDRSHGLTYYRNSKGRFIHLVTEEVKTEATCAIKLISSERYDQRDHELLKAFRSRMKIRHPTRKIQTIALGPSSLGSKADRVDGFTWESLA